jgi:hypothetical protein
LTGRTCGNCAYLVEKPGEASCQVENPGKKTIVDKEEHVCPKWEKVTLKYHSKAPKKIKDDIIIYEIIK